MTLRTAVGVFVNLLVDNKSRLMFKNKKGVSQMVNILNTHGHDWILAMLICQALWNLCIDTKNLYELIPEEEMQELLSILADSLGTPISFVFSEAMWLLFRRRANFWSDSEQQ